MKTVRLEGLKGNLIFRIGKKRFVTFDLVEFVSWLSKASKADSKRIIKNGGVDITFTVEEFVEL